MDRIELVSKEVAEKVAFLPNLSDEQRARVQEIAIAFAVKNQGREVSYEGIANVIRSQAVRPTPHTLVANGGKI
jgi:hypothetical protein